FLVGLELSFDKIRDVGKVAVVAGIGQVVFTAAGGLILCWLLGFPLMEAVFLSVGLTFSSTVVVVKLLDEKGELDSLYGRIAVGIFLVQDLVAILILTFLAGLGGG
ncbi:MAG TPA: portal protein, partial [Verrucomicrobiales bacterium]|nr:portal protein [Verrucomicrobiales bacterium]